MNKKHSRIIAIILAIMLVVCSVPEVAFALNQTQLENDATEIVVDRTDEELEQTEVTEEVTTEENTEDGSYIPEMTEESTEEVVEIPEATEVETEEAPEEASVEEPLMEATLDLRLAPVETVDTILDLISLINDAQSDLTVTALTINLSQDFVLEYNTRPNRLDLPIIRTDLTITINGGGQTLVGNNLIHFKLNNTTGHYAFENMTLQGGNNAATKSAGGIQASAGTSVLTVHDVIFENLNTRAIFGHNELTVDNCVFRDMTALAINSGGEVTVNESHFENVNTVSTRGSAIDFDNKLTVTRSNFINSGGRVSMGGKYTSGAIGSSPGIGRELVVDRCNFVGNIGNIHGGAISLHQFGGSARITNTNFKDNQVVENSEVSDGGAIGLFDNGQTADVLIDNCTFDGNIARDDAGALFFESNHTTQGLVKVTIKNSTFYKNEAHRYDNSGTGGAIQFSLKVNVDLINNTFYGNINKSLPGVLGEGAAVGCHVSTSLWGPRVTMLNNLFVGNEGSAGSSKNVALKTWLGTSLVGTSVGNIGLDNGKTLPSQLTPENVLGATDAPIGDYRTTRTAGRSGSAYETKLKTVMIVPAHLNVAGAEADGSGVIDPLAPSLDARGKTKSTVKSDAGAVEITWVKFNANGGTFNGLAAPVLGNTYYTGATPTDYYLVEDIGQDVTVISGANLTNNTLYFKEWNTQSDGLGTTVTVGSSILATEQTVYAIWSTTPPQPTLYTVTFDSNQGTTVAPITNVAAGSTITAPTQPTKSGYTFAGWYTDNNTFVSAWNFTMDQVNANLTLFAKWTVNNGGGGNGGGGGGGKTLYTVTFDSKGGSSISSLSDVAPGSKISAPTTPQKEGYKFSGWYKDDNNYRNAWDFNVDVVNSNVTLYAKWIPVETYTVTFESNRGSEVASITNIVSGSKITKPKDPTRKGYRFGGWFLDDRSFKDEWIFTENTVTKDEMLFAKWIEKNKPMGPSGETEGPEEPTTAKPGKPTPIPGKRPTQTPNTGENTNKYYVVTTLLIGSTLTLIYLLRGRVED